MKDFEQYTDYLFSQVPMFQNIGGGAYKEGLENTNILDRRFGHPHRSFKTIHIAGTNGKGSCSHTIASILQEAGYKVGLYTSPHLTDFRERIRVNGRKITEQYVMDFIDNERGFFEPLYPTFFELTTALAFKYFADEKVDVAVIEVGMGGRLDCTNIIQPDLSIITNISLDHTQFLGNTMAEIAREKAGIIKQGVPVIIGETTSETKPVFTEKAKEANADIFFAEDTEENNCFDFELKGLYQKKNLKTILCAVSHLINIGYAITHENIIRGLSRVCENTGLQGRWQTVRINPTVICDTGHNIGGITYIAQQLKQQKCDTLRIVFGMVSDKNVDGVLELMPRDAVYYFTQSSVKRAMPHTQIKELAQRHGLYGNSFTSVGVAYERALQESNENDLIFIGGSSFVVADFLKHEKKNHQ